MEFAKFPKHIDGNTEVTVDLIHVLRYMAGGVLYGVCTEEERKALNKISFDPTQDFSATMEKLADEMSKSNIGLTETTLAVTTSNTPVRENFQTFRRDSNRGHTGNHTHSRRNRESGRGRIPPNRGRMKCDIGRSRRNRGNGRGRIPPNRGRMKCEFCEMPEHRRM